MKGAHHRLSPAVRATVEAEIAQLDSRDHESGLMTTALTVSDRAAEIVAWAESLDHRATHAPACLGDAAIHRRVEAFHLDRGAFEAIRAVGREGWRYDARDGSAWLTYQPTPHFTVVLFRK